jgi:hypothetical protein
MSRTTLLVIAFAAGAALALYFVCPTLCRQKVGAEVDSFLSGLGVPSSLRTEIITPITGGT